MNRDADGTLKRVAAMGYEEVETYGLDPAAMTYYRMPARDFAKRLRDHNLPTPSGHYDLQHFLTRSDDDLNRYVDRLRRGRADPRAALRHLAVPRARSSARSTPTSASPAA